MNRTCTCLWFLLVSIGALFASGDEKETLKYERESWVIGISGLSDKGLSEDSSYLLNSLPLLLYNEISDIDEHILSSRERLRYSEAFLKEKLTSLEEQKTSLHSRRDELLFSDKSRRERQKQYRELSVKIEEKEEEILLFGVRDSHEVLMDDSLPVKLRKLYGDEGMVLDQPRVRAFHFMNRENLDFFITGSLEQIDDLFHFTISAFAPGDKDPVLALERTVEEEELEEMVRDAGKGLRSLILGRPWSEISIETLPRSALIMVNGSSIGVGSVRKKDLEPGFATLTISDSGYITDTRQIYLPPEGTQELAISLEEGEESSFYLFSDPPGADVYFGALWMGETPLFTSFPEQKTQIKISKEEYMPFFISSDELPGDSLTVQLGSDLYERELALKDAKSDFYKSLGWFSLSVGVPVIMGGIYQNLDQRYSNYAYSYSQTGSSDYYEKALDYKHQADIAYFAYWGGLALSGSLLVNVFFKLWNYIKAAEESTED